MKVFFPPDGTGCRVVVGQGFLDGFNDDHPDSNLRGLTGATFTFDGEFQLTNVHIRNHDSAKLAGPHLAKLILIVRDWAVEQKPPKASGFRTAFKMPWVIEPVTDKTLPVLPDVAPEPPPAPAEEVASDPWESDPNYDYVRVPGRAVVTRRRKVG